MYFLCLHIARFFGGHLMSPSERRRGFLRVTDVGDMMVDDVLEVLISIIVKKPVVPLSKRH